MEGEGLLWVVGAGGQELALVEVVGGAGEGVVEVGLGQQRGG